MATLSAEEWSTQDELVEACRVRCVADQVDLVLYDEQQLVVYQELQAVVVVGHVHPLM
jgi:hypothetical protein